MKFNIKGKERELKFTYNSFKHMEDLDFERLEEAERKPFIIAGFCSTLLFGALNHNPKARVISQEEVDEELEVFVENGGSVSDLFQSLFDLLQESNFFKSLQKTEEVEK
jgi:hypothetical protein